MKVTTGPPARDLLRGQVRDPVAAGEDETELALLRAVEYLEAKVGVVHEAREVGDRAVGEIVDTDDLVAAVEQLLADVRADEARRAGDAYALHAATRSSAWTRSRIPGTTRSVTPVTACPLTISG